MALMFPRLARNFAKNGYFPTDELTLERTLQAILPAPAGRMRVLDPCAGEGVAIAECAHALGRGRVESCVVEYDYERAEHARILTDRALRSDLMDTIITRQSFGLLWLNPPYGDLPSTVNNDAYQGTGRKRLEKLFYQRSFPLLQYGGVLVFIIPNYTLDAELSGWISNHFSDVRVYVAPEKQFKQVVILGIRTRRNDRASSADAKATRDRLLAVGGNLALAEELPGEWPFDAYIVPATHKELEHFYRVSLEPEQFSLEMQRLGGLWPEFNLHFTRSGRQPRQPARALSPWHLALSLAAGAISGVVTSQSGKTLIVKGNTYKAKTSKVEFTEDENGNITEIRTMVDKFVPVINAWDMTPQSETYGCVLTISSGTDTALPPSQEADRSATTVLFPSDY
jgi:tRNA1(Val) A37 N6-methylase TrmN6